MNVIVKTSKIHGKGVFAKRDFKKGEIVIRWDTSKKINKKEFENLSDNEKKYVALIKGEYIIMQPPAKFVNHSCDANTRVKDFCDIAKKEIKKGEEITGDYSEDETPGFKMLCNCGSKNCKKTIKKI